MSSKFFRFFASDKGRRFVFAGTGCLCIAAFSIKYLPHNQLIEQYRNIIASYQNGVEREVNANLMRRFEKAAFLVDLKPYERELVEAFMVTGFDLYSIGSMKFRQGALLGIPVNFTYTAADEIPRSEIMVKGYEQVDWNSEAGKLLQEGLIFTEAEQVFGMARELYELRTNNVLYESVYAVGSIFIYYSLTSAINQKHRLFTRPLSLRLVLYTLVGLFTTGMYCFIKDASRVGIENYIDEQLSGLGEEYVSAGISFYDKILKKNKAIRLLTGGNQFTATGNINHYFRNQTVPLTTRKQNFEVYLKNLQIAKDKVNEAA